MKRYVFLMGITSILALHAASTPDQTLGNLLDGNQRFVKGHSTHSAYALEAKDKLLEKQVPIAAVVGCSDSRVPPEIIFDKGLGELFVVRDAGNVIGPIEMDSVEFAVAKLNVPLVIVMGHQNCGAIKAAMEGRDHVPELDQIFPYIDAALHRCQKGTISLLKEAIYCNVKNGVETLRKSPTIAPLIQQQKVKVIGAYFDIASGQVLVIE